MLKVSFKGDFRKVQTFHNKATVVTLTGSIGLPDWWGRIPNNIWEWVTTHPSVETTESLAHWQLTVKASGKSVCAEGDSFDAVKGERIAESRAKIKLYKFMYTLTEKLITYYLDLLAGKHSSGGFDSDGTGIADCTDKYKVLHMKETMHLNKLLLE